MAEIVFRSFEVGEKRVERLGHEDSGPPV